MTALEYETKYHQLKVVLADTTTTTVDVRRYQNNDKALKGNANLGNAAALVQKDRLLGKMLDEIAAEKRAVRPLAKVTKDPTTPADVEKVVENEVRRVGNLVHLENAEVLRQQIGILMAVHSGKGSPEEIATVLHLVSAYKLYDKKFGANDIGGVRDYCDKYIGLDCNGFVNNYGKALGYPKTKDTPITSYAKTGRRTRVEDVKADDVMVWLDHGHITVIHSVSPMPADAKLGRDCVVVESTASNPSGGAGTANGGLQHSTYTILSVNAQQVFTVERPKGKGKTNVYIAPIG